VAPSQQQQQPAESNVVKVGQSYKSLTVNKPSTDDFEEGRRPGEHSPKKSRDSKKRKHHSSKSDKHHRHRHDKDKDKKHSSRHSKRRKSENSDSDWSSNDDADDGDRGREDTERSDMKLFLPNGQFIFKEEYKSQTQQSAEKSWTINRSGDFSVFQFGVYRLDIPSYDLYTPSMTTSTAGNKAFTSSDYLAKKNHHLPSGAVAAPSSSSLSRKKRGSGSGSGSGSADDYKLSRSLRYFSDSSRHGHGHAAGMPTIPVYRLWLKQQQGGRAGSGSGSLDNSGQHSMLPFPATLPYPVDTGAPPPLPASIGVSSTIVLPRYDI
jgi:hypothetical protein